MFIPCNVDCISNSEFLTSFFDFNLLNVNEEGYSGSMVLSSSITLTQLISQPTHGMTAISWVLLKIISGVATTNVPEVITDFPFDLSFDHFLITLHSFPTQ